MVIVIAGIAFSEACTAKLSLRNEGRRPLATWAMVETYPARTDHPVPDPGGSIRHVRERVRASLQRSLRCARGTRPLRTQPMISPLQALVVER